MTNYERIKAMSLDEMAEFIGYLNLEEQICSHRNVEMGLDYCRSHDCADCAKNYLEEAEE